MYPPFLTFDTHIDIPWPEKTPEGLPVWERTDETERTSLWDANTKRRFTIPKARMGGLTSVCLTAYSPQGPLTDEGHQAAWKRVNAMLQAICSIPQEAPEGESVSLCIKADDIIQTVSDGGISITPVIENGYPLGEDPARVAFLAQSYGVRYITLTHNGHNLLADSAVVKGGEITKHGGLSSLGREVIGEMNRNGVLVDISHGAVETMMQAVTCSAVPVFASHSCVRALCDHPRNLTDRQLEVLADAGGVVQITAMSPFLKRGGGGTLEDLMAHIRYAVELVGVEHVGISSDFDGGGGIKGWVDASETAHVTQALEKAGFDKSEQQALWGGNMLRLLAQAELYKTR
ncbi:dipeptidase [Acetobacteraceae bacterium ESL0709]|nr:dipeptidase [Acetobacteraceae bacterium ESL0697]MDF7677907.1 dipeptidase [Acetobacteraceae bacterium ESL0709]